MHNMRMFLRTGVKSVEQRLVVHEDIKAMSYKVAKRIESTWQEIPSQRYCNLFQLIKEL